MKNAQIAWGIVFLILIMMVLSGGIGSIAGLLLFIAIIAIPILLIGLPWYFLYYVGTKALGDE